MWHLLSNNAQLAHQSRPILQVVSCVNCGFQVRNKLLN